MNRKCSFGLAKWNSFFTFFREDGKFMAMLRSPNFSREDIEKEYNKLLRRYLRQTSDTKVKKLIDENKEMFLEEFKTEIPIPQVASVIPYEMPNNDYPSMAAEP